MIQPTIVYGREIYMDVYGAPMIFETRLAAETFPGITTQVVGSVMVLHVSDRDGNPAPVDAIAFHEPTFIGRNARLQFVAVE